MTLLLFCSYKHAFDGLYRLVTEDGIRQSFNGGTLGSIRCAVLCVGQLATYDQIKQYLIRSGYFGDNLKLHITTGILTVPTNSSHFKLGRSKYRLLKTEWIKRFFATVTLNCKLRMISSVLRFWLYRKLEMALALLAGVLHKYFRHPQKDVAEG